MVPASSCPYAPPSCCFNTLSCRSVTGVHLSAGDAKTTEHLGRRIVVAAGYRGSFITLLYQGRKYDSLSHTHTPPRERTRTPTLGGRQERQTFGLSLIRRLFLSPVLVKPTSSSLFFFFFFYLRPSASAPSSLLLFHSLSPPLALHSLVPPPSIHRDSAREPRMRRDKRIECVFVCLLDRNWHSAPRDGLNARLMLCSFFFLAFNLCLAADEVRKVNGINVFRRR